MVRCPASAKFSSIDQKRPFRLQEIWMIRIRLELAKRIRDLALLNLAIDSKLRGCDLANLRVSDIAHAGHILHRASIDQRKTGLPVKFGPTEPTRKAVEASIAHASLEAGQFLFASRLKASPHLAPWQYARIVK